MKTLGIISLGTYATLSFVKRLLKVVKPHLIIDDNPTIPSRSRHILFNEASPLKDIQAAIDRTPADIHLIACVTAHYYLPQLNGTFVNMVDLVDGFRGRVIGTQGTAQAGLFGINEYIEAQTVIETVKSGRIPDICDMVPLFDPHKPNLIACTELSAAYDYHRGNLGHLDITDIVDPTISFLKEYL